VYGDDESLGGDRPGFDGAGDDRRILPRKGSDLANSSL